MRIFKVFLMNTIQQDVDERTNLTGLNKFEMLLFRLGEESVGDRNELFGINVFKVREIVAMPKITSVAGSLPNMLGIVNLRGQIFPVIDLPSVVGCVPKTGLNIMLVTEYGRSTQGFAVEAVEEIVRLEWNQVFSAESSAAGGMVTSIARLDGNIENTRLAQVLDVEQILRQIVPSSEKDITPESSSGSLKIKNGAVILAADDSGVARSLIEKTLGAIGAPYAMTKTGKEAWDKLQLLAAAAQSEGKKLQDKVAMVLTDLEMPEMDGFTLTRKIKQDDRYKTLPVIIHSSLSGLTNEEHIKTVGADAYVAKFVAEELASAIKKILED